MRLFSSTVTVLPALFVFSLFAFVGASTGQAQNLIYVDGDASGADDGSSWDNAYTMLQDALTEATDDDVIVVAAGTYYADEGAGIPVDDRESSFTITGAQNGLEVYGGYAGDETISLEDLKLEERDFEANETVLSGDVDQTPGDASGNSFHVLYLDGETVGNITPETRIDGVTVTKGNADGWGDKGAGGGFLCKGADLNECSPTLTNVTFSENRAGSGGAIFNDGDDDGASSPVIENASFTGNVASGSGGGIYNESGWDGESSPTIRSVTFTENVADDDGGAIYNDGGSGVSSPVIEEATFTANSADSEGGAIRNYEGEPTITDATFTENSAYQGGAISTDEGSLTIVRASFTKNSASSFGGAIHDDGHSEGGPVIIDALFIGNSAQGSGAIYTNSEGGSIINAAFSGNQAADGSGAAIYNANDLSVVGSTFSRNVASERGGGIYNEGSSPEIRNSIFFNNTASAGGAQIYNDGEESEPTISYSLIQGACSSIPGNICEAGSISGDPQFANAEGEDGIAGTDDDDLRLQGPGSEDGPSPAIDAGNNDAVPDSLTTDVTGEMSRFYDVEDAEDTGNGSAPIVDMGAYESDSAPLPVELIAFSARTEDENVRLTWQTASETNNAGFRVQHKRKNEANDGSWSKVGFVESKAEGGTSAEAKSYSFSASGLSVGNHTFRLEQVDIDGTTHIHDPVAVKLGMQEALQLSAPAPNPVSGRSVVSFAVKEEVETRITLYNILGQEVAILYEGSPGAQEQQTLQLEAANLASGVYFLRLEAEGQSTTQRVTVVR